MCRTTIEFKNDLTYAAEILSQREKELLDVKTHDAMAAAFHVRECAERLRTYVKRTKLEGM
jgi:hypothetical protein